jgi:hypothetical protein
MFVSQFPGFVAVSSGSQGLSSLGYEPYDLISPVSRSLQPPR